MLGRNTEEVIIEDDDEWAEILKNIQNGTDCERDNQSARRTVTSGVAETAGAQSKNRDRSDEGDVESDPSAHHIRNKTDREQSVRSIVRTGSHNRVAQTAGRLSQIQSIRGNVNPRPTQNSRGSSSTNISTIDRIRGDNNGSGRRVAEKPPRVRYSKVRHDTDDDEPGERQGRDRSNLRNVSYQKNL